MECPASGCEEGTQARPALLQETSKKQVKTLRSPFCPGKIPVLNVANMMTPFFL